MTPINYNFNSFIFSSNPFMGLGQDIFSAVSSANMAGSLGQFGSLTSGFNFNSFSQFNSSFNFQMPVFNVPAFNFPAFNFNFSSNYSQPRRTNFSLTGKRAQDAVRLAESQIGVREIGNTNNGADVNKYRNGVENGVAWCASFVSWCYGQGQGTNNASTFGYDASSQNIRRKAESAGFYQTVQSGYVPQVGDIAVWNYGNNKGHVGIISKVYPDGSFDTIEGNCDNKVQKVRRSRNTQDLVGFVQMNEWIAATENGSRTSIVA